MTPSRALEGVIHKDNAPNLKQTGSVLNFPGSKPISNKDLLELKVDILAPCALEGVIHKDNAPNLKCKILAEGANGPTTPQADKILTEKGVFVIPDVLCNAGGVTASYFEWVQGLQSFFWTEEGVNERLDQIMTKGFHQVYAIRQQENTAAEPLTMRQ